MTLFPTAIDDREAWLGIVRAIDRRKEHEEALRRHSLQLQAVLDTFDAAG